ncbi:uncharacterized protein LOC117238280 [Bombus vosnesenskii]|uniref:Uncharacterized protein LOC117238280 n=1 Tax=Bombus vosnesenskii TaxID=207650 RepID=A0A6J3L3D3_9HYME|nr:uncharacterized protein LOC117238280 [Bombus vosnesenskii]
MRTKFEEPKSSRIKPVTKWSETERNKEPSRSGGARKARCYNCGDAEHVCAECPSKSRGPKCFKCREYGHIASKCDNLVPDTVMQHSLIIGADFLDTVEISIKGGKSSPIAEQHLRPAPSKTTAERKAYSTFGLQLGSRGQTDKWKE